MAQNKDGPPLVAIVGMGLRLPGGVSTAGDFWSFIMNKKDGKCTVPADRYTASSFVGQKVSRQKVTTETGYFLDANLKAFDTSAFPIPPQDVENMDPQQRLLVEVIAECIENAGQTSLAGTNTGVYVGNFGEDWHDMVHMDPQTTPSYHRITCAGDYMLANTVSHTLDLRGPSMTIRTACSASTTGIHLACQALYNGDCQAAIVAGSSLIMSPSMTMDITQQGVLSPTGSCQTFDANADGFARGEAINAILIKRLDDALRDNDPIRAIIRATAVNSDGGTTAIALPSQICQEAMIRRAYEAAGISDITQTPFVECHGTGTQTGDPIEANAVASVFGGIGTYIGSVKTNFGHAEGAAGLNSVIKATLALENMTIPPNIHFTTPNPNIPFEQGKLTVPVEPIPWPENRPARISINSFGIGGANAHVILESAASHGIHQFNSARGVREDAPDKVTSATAETNGVLDERNGKSDTGSNSSKDGHEYVIVNASQTIGNGIAKSSESTNDKADNNDASEETANSFVKQISGRRLPYLLPLSASAINAAKTKILDMKNYVESQHASLDSLAYTLAFRRKHLPYRSFAIARTLEEPLEFSPVQKVTLASAGIAFVFTGQGAQWAGMGRDLIQDCVSFRDDIAEMDRALQSLPEPPSWTLQDVLCSDTYNESIGTAEFAQPICTAVQIALVNLLTKCNVTPAAVVGHSSGEIAAAYSAGALTLSEGIICAFYRGFVMKAQDHKGGMAAVGLGPEAVQPYLADGVMIACENSPKSVTISGDVKGIKASMEAIKLDNADAFVRQLHVDIAYHSHHMQEVGKVYEGLIESQLISKVINIPFYSSVLGKKAAADETEFGSAYWRSNLESPVLFNSAVQALLGDFKEQLVFLEVGPHSALQGPLQQIFRQHASSKPPVYTSTLMRNTNSTESFVTAVGQLFSHGHDVDFTLMNQEAHVLTDLPTYPWDHSKEFWNESRVSKAWRLRSDAHHELLGSRCLEASDAEPAWRNIFRLYNVPWIADHKMGNDVLFPLAGYITMMGEAIRQVTGSEPYSLRNLMMRSGMLVPDDNPIEIMTTMRVGRLTEVTNSSWYDISVYSFNGSTWVQHCVAQGKGGENSFHVPLKRITVPSPRQPPEATYYGGLKRLGLDLGPQFQTLKDVIVSSKITAATASIKKIASEPRARYFAHPFLVDACFQLSAFSSTKGRLNDIEALKVPSYVRRIDVNSGNAECTLQSEVQVHPNGSFDADMIAFGDKDEAAIRVEGATYLLVDVQREGLGGGPNHSLGRLEWHRHIDFCEPASLVHPAIKQRGAKLALQMATSLLILQIMDHIKTIEVSLPAETHLNKYLTWLQNEEQGILSGKWDPTVPEARHWASSTFSQRSEKLEFLLTEIGTTQGDYGASFVHLAHKLLEPGGLRTILSGEDDALKELSEAAETADVFHYAGNNLDTGEFLYLVAHSKPAQKVLQIGAGASAATKSVLADLCSAEGAPMYSEYTITDECPKTLAHAEERLKDQKLLQFKPMDITKSPLEQDFEAASYDLIIVPDTLGLVPSLLPAVLENIHSLLRSEGRLFMRKPPNSLLWRFVPLTMGLLPQWWLHRPDDQIAQDCVSPSYDWDMEFGKAGFSESLVTLKDDDEEHYLDSFIICKPSASPFEPRSVVMLYDKVKHDFGLQLADMLEKLKIDIRWCRIADHEPVEGVDIISTIDLERPYFYDFSDESYAECLEYFGKVKSRMIWLTRPAQLRCTDPRYGLMPGFVRNIRLELGLPFFTVELDALDTVASQQTTSLMRKILQIDFLNDLDALDYEFSVFDNAVHVGRYHWFPMAPDLKPEFEEHEDDIKRLTIGRYGLINSLHWVQQKQEPLGSDEVEVEIRWAGLNFRDLMITMGLIPGAKDRMGIEATGIIRRVGDLVTKVVPGDNVMMMSPGCLSTRLIAHEATVTPFFDEISLEDAATVPVAFSTAMHSLLGLGKLRKGQSILIHTACGSVGLAALAISQLVEAEIYATVGSETKIAYLMEEYGIPRDHIFNSRDASFYEGIMHATNGRGVDLVLNSLSGELLHASWRCVAQRGKMIEIGKRDMYERGSLSLEMFKGNRSFFGVDLEAMSAYTEDSVLQESYSGFLASYRQGKLKPLKLRHIFTTDQVPEALRFLRLGQHIGKILIQMPENEADIPSVQSSSVALLSATSTYLMIGGLGGLGKIVALWMVENGARDFVFLSRSGGKSAEDQHFKRDMENAGCRVVIVAGSVVEKDDVETAVAAALSPIAGVIQMSMVLKNASLTEPIFEDWKAALDPKVRGTWNLHHALCDAKLDFFLLFSSLIGLWGQPSQANYAAANTFLDSFSQYRHSLGLPCSVIDLGAVEEVGWVSNSSTMLKHYRAMNLSLLQEMDVLRAVEVGIRKSQPNATKAGPRGGHTNWGQIAVGLALAEGTSRKTNYNFFKRDIRTSLYGNTESGDTHEDDSGDASIKEFIRELSKSPERLYEPETVQIVSERVGMLLHEMMMLPTDTIDITVSLSSLGIDSLHSVEMRDRLRRAIGMDINILDIKNAGTIEGLGRLVIAKMKEKLGLRPDKDSN